MVSQKRYHHTFLLFVGWLIIKVVFGKEDTLFNQISLNSEPFFGKMVFTKIRNINKPFNIYPLLNSLCSLELNSLTKIASQKIPERLFLNIQKTQLIVMHSIYN